MKKIQDLTENHNDSRRMVCAQLCVHNKDSQFYGVRFQQEQIKLVDYALQMTTKLR